VRTEQQLRDALDLLAEHTPDVDDVLTRLLQVPQSTAGRRSGRRAILVAVTVGLALALLGGFGLAHLMRQSDPAPTVADGAPSRTVAADMRRVPGNWAMISHVEPPPGWSTDSREISGDVETTTMNDASGKGVCWVEADGRGVAPTRAISTSARPATVDGHPARYQAPPGRNAAVYWHYRPDAWASVTCTPGPLGLSAARTPQQIRQLIIQLAGTVTFGNYPLLLPIRLGHLPPGYMVQSAQQAGPKYLRSWSITLSPVRSAQSSSTAPIITISADNGSIPDANTSVLNYPATFFTAAISGPYTPVPRTVRSFTSLCVPSAPVGICVNAGNTAGADPESRRKPFHTLASQITYAASATDTRTWFDATTALPS